MVTQLTVFLWLLWQDIRVFFHEFFSNLFNAIFWPTVVVLVSNYILPLIGMPSSYGSFILVGTVASMCLFDSVNKAQAMVSNMESSNSISYQLVLPISATGLLLKIATSFALTAAFMNMLTLPVGKLLLGSSFDMTAIDPLTAIAMFILINIFFGMFGLWIAGWAKAASDFRHIWMRFVLPLWMLGCYQFPWHTIRAAYPLVAYLDMLNPMVYAFEGVRGALLPTEQHISLAVCATMLILFSIGFFLHAYLLFKRRLDFV